MTLKGTTTIFKLGMGFVGGVKKVLLSLHMHAVKKKKNKNLKLFHLFYLTREHLTTFFVVLVHFLKV